MDRKLLLLIAALLLSTCRGGDVRPPVTATPSPTQTATPIAEDQEAPPRPAKPEEIPFTYDANTFTKVEVKNFPKRVAEPDSFPDEAPSYNCFYLEDKRPLPAFEKGPRYFYPAYSTICIIPLTDASEADFAKSYPNVTDAAAKLRKLLQTRPAKFDSTKDIFDFPYNNAGGVIESQVQYLNFNGGSGVLFLTQYTQEMQPTPINNEELTCDFQGITDDGKYYVSARLAITHPSLPKGIDSTDHIQRDDHLRYLKKQEEALNGFSEDSFQPSLKVLKSMLASISIK